MTLFITVWLLLAVLLWWYGPQLLALGLRLYVHRLVHADFKAKCPCCGIRAPHVAKYNESLGKLVHLCAACGAPWAEDCMVNPERWRVAFMPQDEDIDADGVHTTTVQNAQREPVLVREYKPTGKNKPVVVRGGQV